jgi:hypothetical protein
MDFIYTVYPFPAETLRGTNLLLVFLYSFIPFVLFDGDQGTASKDLVQVPIGPVTRARAKKFKDVLNGLIQELWAQANSGRPIEHDPRGQQRIVTLIQVLEGSGQG